MLLVISYYYFLLLKHSELGAQSIHVLTCFYLVCVSYIFILHKFGLNHFIIKLKKLSVINNNKMKN